MPTRRSFLSAAPAVLLKSTWKLATFTADITPPVGTPLCFGLIEPGRELEGPLEARGVVIYPEREQPIVLCALDWLGVGNQSHDRWRTALAGAAGTSPARVAVHTVHPHDAPGEDVSAEEILRAQGLPDVLMSGPAADRSLHRVAAAVKAAQPRRITHYSSGRAPVAKIASNRRILDQEKGGKVIFGRMSSCRDHAGCAAPEGVIDPLLRSVSFWEGTQRIATLAYYAAHPMSYYGKGGISADFPALARQQQDAFTVYFTGAAGNVGAGKYNTGAREDRAVLARRLADGMRDARAAESKYPLESMQWRIEPVALPHREGEAFTEVAIERVISDERAKLRDRASAGRFLAWQRLVKAGRKIDLTALHIGSTKLVHAPGELFVEYQLALQKERGADLIALAAYGDYGPMYIGTAKAYDEGGYETSLVSRVAPAVEGVLTEALVRVAKS